MIVPVLQRVPNCTWYRVCLKIALKYPKQQLLCFEWSPPWHSIHPIWPSIWHSISGIPSDILSGISSDILSGISFDTLPGTLPGRSSDILSGISSDSLSGIPIWHSIWNIFWHSIWHIFRHSTWHSTWQIFWHSIWHIFWQSIWHTYLAFYLEDLLTFYLAYLLTLYLADLLTFYLAYLLTFYLAFYLADLLTFYLFYLLAFCLSYLLTFYLACLLTFYLAYLLTFYLAFYLAFYMALFVVVEMRLRSGEAHGAQNLAGWGPARPAALRISPVEVRRGPQRSESRRLRSGEAHCDRAGSGGPARPTAIKIWQMRSGEVHCDQELADEIRRGGGRRGGGRTRRTSARSRASDIKSNNPHLAGGEIPWLIIIFVLVIMSIKAPTQEWRGRLLPTTGPASVEKNKGRIYYRFLSNFYQFLSISHLSHRIHVWYIIGNIYHQYTPNVNIYTIHGSYGYFQSIISVQKKKRQILQMFGTQSPPAQRGGLSEVRGDAKGVGCCELMWLPGQGVLWMNFFKNLSWFSALFRYFTISPGVFQSRMLHGPSICFHQWQESCRWL